MNTKSEIAFEAFLIENNLAFERVDEGRQRRPDYLVRINGVEVLFEVKELAEDENFKPDMSSRTVGDHIRQKMLDSRKQVQFGARQGKPSVLLVYNNIDPIHLFGTEDFDFITAMYGEYTLSIDKSKMAIVDSFHGRNSVLGEAKNTSFSAVARLSPIRGKLTVALFENVFAKVPLPYEGLPTCFDVRRITVTYSSAV